MLMDKLPLEESITPIAVDMHRFHRVKHGITCLSFVILITLGLADSTRKVVAVFQSRGTLSALATNIGRAIG